MIIMITKYQLCDIIRYGVKYRRHMWNRWKYIMCRFHGEQVPRMFETRLDAIKYTKEYIRKLNKKK